MISSTQYDTEVKVTRSEMVQKLMEAKDTCFTVTFRKQLNGKRLLELVDTYLEDDEPPSKRIKTCNNILKDGEERVMTGFIAVAEPCMGRTSVVDLNVPQGQHALRLVDHRTVEELILKRVKYVLK